MKALQWLYSIHMKPHQQFELTPNGVASPNPAKPIHSAGGPMGSRTETFPFTVPAGHWLGLVDATLQSKMTSKEWSYLVFPDLLSVSSHQGQLSFRPPLVLAPGFVLRAVLINNSAVNQWMNVSVQALLEPQTDADYRNAFAGGGG